MVAFAVTSVARAVDTACVALVKFVALLVRLVTPVRSSCTAIGPFNETDVVESNAGKRRKVIAMHFSGNGFERGKLALDDVAMRCERVAK